MIGLFRYRLIREAADPGVGWKARGRMVRALAEQTHTDPFGRQVRISRASLDRWIRAWRAGGFEALVPVPRQSANRTDPETLALAAMLKQENTGRTTAQVQRILVAQTGWAPSHSTLLRHFHRLGLQLPPGVGSPGEAGVFGRFEADRCNELWTGDALHGPRIGAGAGRKTYLFAFIDDHSRLLTGYRWGFAEDTVRLAAALRKALSARGVPEAVYVDNGSAYCDAWLLRACATLGVKLTHSTPRRPQGRGKIERFWRTVNDQFLVEISNPNGQPSSHLTSDDPAAALLELNGLFSAWVEQVYHRGVHSETGQTPLARWHAGWHPGPPAIPDPATLREAFLWEERRTVTKTATVSLHSNTYQVDPALAGRRVELVFDPFDMTDIQVRHQGHPAGTAIPHRITRHSHPKARPETPEPDPAPSTGIDYLNLVATTHHSDVAEAINFAALTNPGLDAELAAFAQLRQDLADASDDPLDPLDPLDPEHDQHHDDVSPDQHDDVSPDQLDLIDLLTATTADQAVAGRDR